MPSSHPILCHPLLLLPSVFPSVRIVSNKLALRIRWPKYRSFSFSISPSNEYSGLISFWIDWLDLLAVRGTLKSSPAPQFKSINFLALSFLYGLTLTFIPDKWKSHFLLLFSPSVVSDSLQSHGLQHTRLSCPSPSPSASSNSCPLSR